MNALLEQLLDAITPPKALANRDSAVRNRVHAAVQRKWTSASVHLFGSAASRLRVGAGADVDLCIDFPSHRKTADAARDLLTTAADGQSAARDVAAEQLVELEAARDALEALRKQLRDAEGGKRRDRRNRRNRGRNIQPAQAPEPVPTPVAAAAILELVDAQTVELRIDFASLLIHAQATAPPTAQSDALRERLVAAAAEVKRLEALPAVRDFTEEKHAYRRAQEAVQKSKRIVYPLAAHLREAREGGAHLFADVTPIARARTAVVKCVDVRTKTQVDIVVNKMIGVHNSRLLATYAEVEPRFAALALLTKTWASRRALNRAGDGLLSSYAHVLTVVHYLQAVCRPPLLPDLQDPVLVERLPEKMCDGLDVRHAVGAHAMAAKLALPGAAATSDASLAERHHGYFEWLASIAEAGAQSITYCVRARGSGTFELPRESCRWSRHKNATADADQQHRLSLEDPFLGYDSADPLNRHDLGTTLSMDGMERLRAEWRRAASLLRQAKVTSDASSCKAIIDEWLTCVDEAAGAVPEVDSNWHEKQVTERKRAMLQSAKPGRAKAPLGVKATSGAKPTSASAVFYGRGRPSGRGRGGIDDVANDAKGSNRGASGGSGRGRPTGPSLPVAAVGSNEADPTKRASRGKGAAGGAYTATAARSRGFPQATRPLVARGGRSRGRGAPMDLSR